MRISTRARFEGVQVVDAEGPDFEGNFEDEERGDHERDIFKGVNPLWELFRRRALREKEVVCEGREDTEGVDDDLYITKKQYQRLYENSIQCDEVLLCVPKTGWFCAKLAARGGAPSSAASCDVSRGARQRTTWALHHRGAHDAQAGAAVALSLTLGDGTGLSGIGMWRGRLPLSLGPHGTVGRLVLILKVASRWFERDRANSDREKDDHWAKISAPRGCSNHVCLQRNLNADVHNQRSVLQCSQEPWYTYI